MIITLIYDHRNLHGKEYWIAVNITTLFDNCYKRAPPPPLMQGVLAKNFELVLNQLRPEWHNSQIPFAKLKSSIYYCHGTSGT